MKNQKLRNLKHLINLKINIYKYFVEIKTRIFYILFSFVLTFSTSYIFSDELIYLLALPLKQAYFDTNCETKLFSSAPKISAKNINVNLDVEGVAHKFEQVLCFRFIFTDLTEAFTAALHVSLFISFYVTLPVILYQFWLFIKPGLYLYEKKQFEIISIMSFAAAAVNLLITYFFILPAACNFFLSFEIGTNSDMMLRINLEPKIYTYLCLVLKFLLWSQILFQIPVFLLILTKLGILSSKTALYKIVSPKIYEKEIKDSEKKDEIHVKTGRRKMCYGGLTLLSGLLSPPDIFSQLICCIFSIFIFEICVFILILDSRDISTIFKTNWDGEKKKIYIKENK